ncbi:hypothetical protein KP509_1Z275800 [Ceratopteris richardii]|nr:hypothetical protein KP509_1Z275800 [Ceratopteris richardii]
MIQDMEQCLGCLACLVCQACLVCLHMECHPWLDISILLHVNQCIPQQWFDYVHLLYPLSRKWRGRLFITSMDGDQIFRGHC